MVLLVTLDRGPRQPSSTAGVHPSEDLAYTINEESRGLATRSRAEVDCMTLKHLVQPVIIRGRQGGSPLTSGTTCVFPSDRSAVREDHTSMRPVIRGIA